MVADTEVQLQLYFIFFISFNFKLLLTEGFDIFVYFVSILSVFTGLRIQVIRAPVNVVGGL